MYTDLYLRKPVGKYKSILSIVLAITLLGAGFYYFQNNPQNIFAAQGSITTQELVNVSPSQFGVMWSTDEVTTGWLLYGTQADTLASIAKDIRDSGEPQRYNLHLATIKAVQPNTVYYYQILTDNKVVNDVNGKPFTFKTPKQTAPGSLKPAYGKLYDSTGRPVKGANVVLKIPGTYPLVTFTKETGEWLLPLQFVFKTKNLAKVGLQGSDTLPITLTTLTSQKSVVAALVSYSNPIPKTVIAGTDYRFLTDGQVLPASTSRAQENRNHDFSVYSPTDGAVIPGLQPLIKGSGIPGDRISVELNSQPRFIATAKVNILGSWIVNVPKPLTPGSYQLSVTGQSTDGGTVTLVRSFTLAKDGEQVLGEATSSASPTIAVLSPTYPATPTPTPLSAEPEITPIESPTPTITIPLKLTVTTTIAPNTPAPPVTGANPWWYIGFSVALLFIGSAALFFL